MAERNGAAFHLNTWPDATTPGEVAHYATGGFSNALILFLAAERAQDTEQMHLHCKAMRQVVTRIDQFRRMRVRQWRVQQGSSPKNTSPPAASEK
jgi:hypothetical protein